MNFKEFYLTENENEKFDIKTLDSIKGFSQKIKYAKKFLKRLGEGSSRIVFDLEDGYVLKLAKNEKGLEQNLTDGDYGLQRMYPDIIPELKDRDENDDCYWLIVKKGTKITTSQFKQLTGTDFKTFGKALTDVKLYHDGRIQKVPDESKKYWEDEDNIVNHVADLMINYDMPYGDLVRISSWGAVDGKAKIVDAGLTNTTFNTYYRKK